MAIKDTTRKPFIEDNDENIFIGLDLPIRKEDGHQGYFASTKTTIEAVKNNIRNLLNTHQGERLMQPILGINLRKHLFEQINPGMTAQIQEDISATFRLWLPFVQLRQIKVRTNSNDKTINPSTMVIDIIFNIVQDPNTLASVQIEVTGAGQNPDAQTEF